MDQSVSRIFAVVVWVAIVSAVLWILGGAAFTLLQKLFGRISVVVLSVVFLVVALPDLGATLAAAGLLLALPAALGAAVFFSAAPIWCSLRLRHPERGLRAIRLQVGDRIACAFAEPPQLTPILPLAAAALAGLAAVVAEWAFTPAPGWAASYWSRSAVFAGGTAVGLPFLCASIFWNRLGSHLAATFARRAERRLAPDIALLRSVARAEALLIEACAALGVTVPTLSADAFTSLLGERAAFARRELQRTLDDLGAELAQMRDCLLTLREVQQQFETTKQAVVLANSSTLLQDLDKVRDGMAIDVPEAFQERKWAGAASLLRRMAAELTVIDRAARMAESDDAIGELELPETIEQAYAVLNVNPETNREVIGRLVRALRQTWHPDLARDEQDRLKRTAKLQQIHSAWDFINARSAAE